MADKRPKPQTRTPGAPRGFVLPERQERAPDENPMRETIRAATAGEPAPVTPPTALTPLTPLTPPAAPAKDFQRVANSIVRDAVPAGVFKGKGKQLYDFLYLKTRGAIVPVRSKRIRKEDILQGAHIGSERTLYKNLRVLSEAGLVSVRSIAGEQEGSEYTVYLPEEVTPLTALTPPTSVTPPTDASHSTQKVVSPLTAESGVSAVTQAVDFQRPSDESKTSLKTNTERATDDEATAPLRELERELKTKPGDWRPALQLLADEIRRAASNTSRVSDPAKFAETHLAGLFAAKSRPARPQPQTEARQTPPEEIAPPDDETLAEFEQNRAKLPKKD